MPTCPLAAAKPRPRRHSAPSAARDSPSCRAALSSGRPSRSSSATSSARRGSPKGTRRPTRRVQARFFERMDEIVVRHGGTVERFVGDEVMAVFGVPVVHEDDALRAVRAAQGDAARPRRAERRAGGRARALASRSGSGSTPARSSRATTRTGDAFVAGEPVILAKRLEQAADAGRDPDRHGDVPARQARRHGAGPRERFSVKGKQSDVGPLGARRCRPRGSEAGAPPDAPLVGRDDELQLLRRAFERTSTSAAAASSPSSGRPGSASRGWRAELRAWLDDRRRTSVGRCLSYGEGITFWPLAEHSRTGRASLREALSTSDQRDDGPRVLTAVTELGDGPERGESSGRFGARSRLGATAAARPLLRGPALGRADDARPRRVRRRLEPRGADPHRCASAAGTGRGTAQLDLRRSRNADALTLGRCRDRHGVAARPTSRAMRCRPRSRAHRGSPRRATRSSSSRSARWPPRTAVNSRSRLDPGAPRRAARPAERGRARRDRARRRGRQGLPRRGRSGTLAGRPGDAAHAAALDARP